MSIVAATSFRPRRRRGQRALLPLEEAERRLRPFNRHYVGVRPVPVELIVGTDGRGADFDRDFRPRRPGMRERWQRLEQAFPDGGFPPIVASKLGDAYFVVDGHHRVAIARARGYATVDADVTELHARWHLPADADLVELVRAEQQRIFLDESGLGDAGAAIRPSSPAGYVELLENVQIHGYHALFAAGRMLTRAEVAADWLERAYRPTLAAIGAEGLDGLFADATAADLYLHAYRRRRENVPDGGCPSLADVVRELAAEERARRPLLRRRAAR